MRSLELFGLVYDRHTGVHGLHTEYLIIALLIIEHGSRKVVEHIFDGQRSIRLYVIIGFLRGLRFFIPRS